ncbi:hypothetical protein [Sphingobium sp. TomTYG45]
MTQESTSSIVLAQPGGASTIRADQLVPMVGPESSVMYPDPPR